MKQATWLVAAAMLALGGCEWMQGPGNHGEPGEPGDDVALQRARWRSAGIVDYQYTSQQDCFCTPESRAPHVVTVRNGRVVSVVGRGGVVDTTRNPGRTTVEGLFDLIERANASADEVRVSYDPRLGFPTQIWIDWSRQAADEESGYTITNFTR